MNQDRLLSSSILSSFLIFIFLLFLISSCDNTGPTGQMETETESIENQFFSFTPDSVGPALTMAMDTLRKRNVAQPFVKNFIDQRSNPSWDHYRVFPKENRIILLVPVAKTKEERVSGIWAISVKQKQPTFRWIPRGAKLEGSNQPDKTALEIFMLGFENRIRQGKTAGGNC